VAEKAENADVSTAADQDQEILGDAIIGRAKTDTAVAKTEDQKSTESSGAETKKAEAKTEEKAGAAEPSGEDKQVDAVLKQFKGDSKQVAKGYANLKSLMDAHNAELGQLRREKLAWEAEQQKIKADPKAYADSLVAQTRTDQGNLLDRVLDDPAALDRYILDKVGEGIEKFRSNQQQEEALTAAYPQYREKKATIAELRQLVQLGKIPEDELYLWAIDGYGLKDKLNAAKEIVREENEQALAVKHAETSDKQAVVSSEKEAKLDVNDPEVQQEVLGNAILGARRGGR